MAAANSYYFEQLNKEQKKAYHAMMNGLLELSPAFAVPRLSARELSDIYFLIRLDHPEIFWSTSYHYRFYPDSEAVEFMPDYLFPKKQIREHQKAMTARISRLVRGAADCKSDLDKEIYIHDFICRDIRYDKLKKAYSHEIIGSLGQGVAVCEGMAKAVKALCDAMGIWCVIALSGNNPEKGIRYRHTWNVIRIDGKLFHLDATFDNTLTRGVEETGLIRYDYFNLGDKQIFRDHEPVLHRLPACSSNDQFYYLQRKLSFTKTEDVRKRSLQAAKKGRPLLFHWRGGYLTREVLQELVDIFREEGAKKGKVPRVSVNWAQAVLLVLFEDLPEAVIRIEEVNEEENDNEGRCESDPAGDDPSGIR